MTRNVALLVLVSASSLSFAQVTGVSRECRVEYSHFLGINATVVDPSGSQSSPTTFADNSQNYDHTDSISGTVTDWSQVPPVEVPYSGTTTTHADQDADVTLLGGGLRIVGTNHTTAFATGLNVINEATSQSFMNYRFDVGQDTTFSVVGTDSLGNFGSDFSLFSFDANATVFRSSFEANPKAYNFTSPLAAGHYEMRINSFVLANQSAVGQSQTFDFQVAAVPEPTTLAALGLGAFGLLRRRSR